jgi:glyoxylase-like metal-dependent hydrolase (beta-lactamase superfamily II)
MKLPIPAPDGQLNHVNVYLIGGDGDWLLVDTGWNASNTFDALEKQLGETGVGFKDITRIVITHFHVDHYGLAGRLRELSGAKVAMHRMEKEFVDSRYVNMDELLTEIARWLHLHGVPEKELTHLQKASLGVRKFAVPVLPDIALEGGERISVGPFNFEVLWTPGHSLGHICLYESAKRILLSGDHILPTIFPNVGLHPQSGDNPLGDYLDSLKVCGQLDVDLVLPAHEEVFTDLKKRIGELYHHQEERKEAILGALKDGGSTAYEISHHLSWIVNGVTLSYIELSSLDKRLAVMSALAHLEPLRNGGEVERTSKEGIFFYSRV